MIEENSILPLPPPFVFLSLSCWSSPPSANHPVAETHPYFLASVSFPFLDIIATTVHPSLRNISFKFHEAVLTLTLLTYSMGPA